MDRGRCGYDLVGNKFLREKALDHKRNVHLERLQKIKNRQPGTSSTLDNNPPESLLNNKFTKNPRKWKKKTERNLTIQRQNKVLLQRISNILTAPPKVTDQDYQNMKKLMHSLDHVDDFTKNLRLKRNKQFFERVRKTEAYYHPHDWELDYQKQLEGQKFMRQVNYERPKDWVDPFRNTDPQPTSSISPKRMTRPSTVCSSSPSRYSTHTNITNGTNGTNGTRTSKGNSHINRLKHLRQSNSATNTILSKSSSYSAEKENERNLKNEYEENNIKDENDVSELEGNDDYEEEDNFDEETVSDSFDRVLAKCERKILVTVLDEPVIVQRPMIRQPSVRSLSIIQTPQLQQQLSDVINTSGGGLASSSSATTTTPTANQNGNPNNLHHVDHRRTLVSGASRRNLLAEMHQNQHSLRSLHSLHHSTSGPVPQPPPVIMNVAQLQTQSNGITYEISVEIICSIHEEHLHIEVRGKDDTSVQSEMNIHPIDLTGVTSTKGNPSPNVVTSNSNNINSMHDDSSMNNHNLNHNENNNNGNNNNNNNNGISVPPDNVPYNWTFPTNKILQNKLGDEVVNGIQLCVRGGQEFSIILPDPTKLNFEIDPKDENESIDDSKYTSDIAKKILQEYEPVTIKTTSLIPVEVFYPIVVSSPVRQTVLTRQKTGWNEVKSQFLWKSEKVGLLIKVKRISEEKAHITGLVIRDSLNKFYNSTTHKVTPAIQRDSQLDIIISLPSILSIDYELIKEYYYNAVQNLKIKHNGTTGENKFLFE